MTAGFAADTAESFRGLSVTFVLCLSLLCAPAYLAMFRWCKIGKVAIWCITALSFSALLVSGLLLKYGGLAVLLLVESLIFSAIASGSIDRAA